MKGLNRRTVVLSMTMAGAAMSAGTKAFAASATHTVVMDKMKFGPMPKDVHVGDTILWVNNDLFRHTATAKDKSFEVDLPSRAEGRTVLAKAGTITVLCRFHPGMTAELIVAP